MSNIEERVDKIATRLTIKEPFLATIFSRLERRYEPVGTACVDGKTVWFDPAWCGELSDKQLLFVVLHETLHVALMHNWRRKERNPCVFNMACDLIINYTLAKMGYRDMPSGGIAGDSVPWMADTVDSEEAYARLMREGQGKGQGGFGNDLKDAPAEISELDMQATVQTAAKMAKACGKESVLLERILGGCLEQKVSWLEALRHVLTSSSKGDYTFARVNRRFVSSGIYLPSLWSPSIGGLVVGIDTSGSMGQEELDQAATEITAIAEDCHPEWVLVLYCDSALVGTQRFEQGEDIQLVAKGGGGTRFKPVFDYIEEEISEPIAALVYFTDLYGNTSELDPPEYPVIWGVTCNNRVQVPFGDVVQAY